MQNGTAGYIIPAQGKGEAMTIEDMRNRKIELGISNKALAERAGVPLGTVQKIFSGETKAPREATLKALERILAPVHLYTVSEPPAGVLRETMPAYNVKGPYTLEDYLALPEERRVELIDGEFYEMYAPTTGHQAIGGFIHKQLLDHVLDRKGPCMPLMSPVDVQLDCDDKTVVQPDVMIVCDKDKFRGGRVFGAPDYLAEVLSPSTRKKDMSLKLYKYSNAGVREYWMVDPEKQKIVVYDLEHEDIPKIFSFDDKVPVLIWNGDCEIDFPLIRDFTRVFFEQ